LCTGATWRERVKLGNCPICGLSVRGDDAIGLVGSRLGHAECALARWSGFAPFGAPQTVSREDASF
jgi:hypothetical protein